ncbi:MAG: carboxypeptidase regulatory-like domain-containing protein, partial [Undibacterium sp.]|nr:carboxypeptidase regulatory-like domain-containing protein [Opitutaceae bacterium]
QAQAEVLFSADDLRSARSAPVFGPHEPAAALALLLKPTGFTARRNLRGKFVLFPAPPPGGALRGRILAPDTSGAAGIRLNIDGTNLTATTNRSGAFAFPSLGAGTYTVVATGRGYQPLQIIRITIEPGHTLTLDAQTLRAASDLLQLEPVVVEGRSARLRPFDRGQRSDAPRIAAGNLDLPRTEDDVLPYVIYDRQQISRSGVVSLSEFLAREVVDSDALSRPPEQTAGIDLASITGSTNLSLRGYKADETILLLNGRRLPEVTISGSVTQQPDVNFIPLSLVQRVEVLPVSASALYSGNPVGGVINIVLRPDAEGSEVTTTYTNALHRFDAPQSSVSVLHGQTLLDGALRLRLSATFTRTEPATEAELGHIRAHLTTPALSDPVFRATPNVRSADGLPLFAPDIPSVTSVAPGADGTGGLAAFNGRAGLRSLGLYDSADGLANSSASLNFPYGRRQEGESYFGSASCDLTPWLQLGLDGIYTRTAAHRGYNVFKGDLTLDAVNPLNPFGRTARVSLLETAPLLGADYGEARVDFSSFVLGALVKLPADWRASIDAQYGRNLTHYRGLAGVDNDRWQQLVDEKLYNPLRDTQRFGPPTAFYDRALKYYGARGRFVTLGDYTTLDAAVRITNQNLTLPTGRATVSAGGDFRMNHLASYAGRRTYGDGSPADTPSPTSARTVQRISLFGEVQASLIPTRWLPSWIHDVKTEVAARYVAAATSQESNLAPTGGLKFNFAGGFALRATVATSNRLPAPVLSRATAAPVVPGGGGGGEVTYVSVKDALRGNQLNETVTSSELINSALRPESAVTRTLGLVYQRGQIHRFRASFDIAETRKSGELQFLGESGIVGLESLFPGRVTRAASTPGDPYPVGRIQSILTGTFNLAYRHSQNWTTALDYAWTECLGGRLDVYGRWLMFQRYDLQILPGGPTVDELSTPDGVAPGLLRPRVDFGTGWSSRHYGFGLDGHYFHSRVLPASEWAAQGARGIPPQWQFDAYVQTDLARWLPWSNDRYGLRAQLRVNNFLDAKPARYAADTTRVGVQPYGDWRGPVYSLSVTATF